MTRHSEFSDEALLGILKAALDETDPVPASVIEAAKAACDWSDIDYELAVLTYDSLRNPAGVRGADTDRQLNFEAAEIELVILVVRNGDRLAIEGQLIPARPTVVELINPEMSISTHTRDLGRFSFEDVRAGQAQLRVTSLQLLTEHFTL